MSPFRLDGCQFFLTYPHSTFSHGDLHSFLATKGEIRWCRVCTELHEDGEPHVHAVVKFAKRLQSRSASFFDYLERHPNIQSVRDVRRSLDYVTKDGEFTDFGDVPAGSTKRTHEEALALATGDEGEYLRACMEAKVPFQYAKRIREIELARGESIIDELYQALLEWEREDIRNQTLPENKCAVLVGPSGCGKSCWAKRVAPKPALWVSHIDVLRSFNPAIHKSIIFDDMCFKHMPLQTQIHLVDWIDSRQIHCRYGYATIPAKTVKIFTCNEFPFTKHPAIDRRVCLRDLYL